MPSLYVASERRGQCTIARILWEKVSDREVEIVQPEILAAVGAPPLRLVVDLSAVTLLASPGLGMLITLHKKAKESGGAMAITGLSPAIREVLTLTRLHKLLTIEESLDSAVKRVGG